MTVTQASLAESTLTARYQTTIPEPVRKALGLSKHDKISYSIGSDGQVIISRAESEEDDPLLGQFLNFLALDIEKSPQNLQVLGSDLVERVQALVGQIEVDLDAPLSDEDE
jgi:antitoxin PrlF